MEKHIQTFLRKISYIAITISTLTLLLLFLQTPQTCLNKKFPKSSCDAAHRPLTTLPQKTRRLHSSKAWRNAVVSFSSLFQTLRSFHLLSNASHVLCLSAGPGHPVAALNDIGVAEVTGVELVESPPLVRKADPNNLPFFEGVFDVGFGGFFDRLLFPGRVAWEMERVVKGGGVSVVAVEECGEVGEVVGLFRKSRLVRAMNVSLMGDRVTVIVMRLTDSA